MSALKKLKKSRKSHQSGGHSDLNGSPLTEGFASQEGNTGMQPGAKPDNGSHPESNGPLPDDNMKGGSGMSQFEVGNQQTGGRRRRRRSGSKSKRRGQSQSQSQSGGKHRKSRRGRGRRRSYRGGSLSYSQY
jgi:hypothetical protein